MAIERGFRQAKVFNEIIRARDGVEALEIMRGQHDSLRLTKPCIVLLDLNMPRMDGFTFLDELRKDSDLHKTVVFVLTTSKDDVDRSRAYERYIAGYIVKENTGVNLNSLIQTLENYWRLVDLP